MGSLRLRLLGLTSLLLALGFALVGGVLDRSFVVALEQAQRDRLQAHIYTLLEVAEPDVDATLRLPYDLPEPRMNVPDSGLYADIRDDTGSILWQSRSGLGIDVTPAAPLPEPGTRTVLFQESSNNERLQALSFGVVWEFDSVVSEFGARDSVYFAFTVHESRASLQAELAQFRAQLYASFGVVALGILVAMGLLLGWLLRPLGRIAGEIEAVEQGGADRLSVDYPSELQGVAGNLNTLLDSEARRAGRYQQTLANLAHSLKTPLAAAQTLLDEERQTDEGLRAQLARMEDIVRYQLARPAAASGQTMGRSRTSVAPLVTELLTGLDRVYLDKRVAAELVLEDALEFRGDPGDLMEVLGNVIDNAYKWCERRVVVTVQAVADDHLTGLMVQVDDDGPGFPEDNREQALSRGHRLDESTPGTGIGLSVVRDLAAIYGGSVVLGTSAELGGARVTVTLGNGA